uniref:YceI family protein n=1 Tax=Ekhidna sp. TaxID=2608089 RepID=UPI0032EB4113
MIFLLACLAGFSQRFKAGETYIKFYSDAPIEDIEAEHISVSSLLDIETRALVIVIPIKSFVFKKKLMQEHFNENYLESDKYPNATFKGKIEDWDGSHGETDATAIGTLEIHGVIREIRIKGVIEYVDEKIKLSTVFPIKLEDYKIKIPKAVFYNIAEEVEVTAKLEYLPYEKN